jgi:hypothetical protein
MTDAMKDAEDSKAGDVGIGNPDTGEDATNDADLMANYVNERKKGGKR